MPGSFLRQNVRRHGKRKRAPRTTDPEEELQWRAWRNAQSAIQKQYHRPINKQAALDLSRWKDTRCP